MNRPLVNKQISNCVQNSPNQGTAVPPQLMANRNIITGPILNPNSDTQLRFKRNPSRKKKKAILVRKSLSKAIEDIIDNSQLHPYMNKYEIEFHQSDHEDLEQRINYIDS